MTIRRHQVRKTARDAWRAPDDGVCVHGMIIERMRRLQGLIHHPWDLESSVFMRHFLGSKRCA